MFSATSITFSAHLGIGLGVETGSRSRYDSTWSSASDSEYETLTKILSYAKGLGRMNLPSLSNNS